MMVTSSRNKVPRSVKVTERRREWVQDTWNPSHAMDENTIVGTVGYISFSNPMLVTVYQTILHVYGKTKIKYLIYTFIHSD